MDMYVGKLVEEIADGKIVLPDFQRNFVWDPDRVRELVVSVLGDYFIGSMLMLEDFREEDSPFALRLIYGVKEVNKLAEVRPVVHIILDGQQRATALLYALTLPDKPLRYRKNPYKLYIDVREALNGNWDAAVISVNKGNKKELNKAESEPNVIPLPDFINTYKLAEIFPSAHPKVKEIFQLADKFRTRPIHVVTLSKDTGLEKIVETFERSNRFSVALSIFELLTARLRKYRITLPDLWKEAQKSYEFARADKSTAIDPEFILRIIALLRGKGTKRGDLLALEHKDFREDWKQACKMLNTAYRRLISPKRGYGVLSFPKWLPYTTMVVPLAAILGFLKAKKLDNNNNYNKIDQWYWTSVFSNRYDEGAIAKQETDYNKLKKWILDDDEVPDFVQEFKPARDVSFIADKQNSATYRGVINLVVLEGARDFLTGQSPQLDEEHVQDDHIFPKSIYNEHRILNRTLITTNERKAKRKPSSYFKDKLQKHGEAELKRILASHVIPGTALPFLLADDIQGFLKARRKAIIKKIKQKVGSRS
jgi:hypothetical protein